MCLHFFWSQLSKRLSEGKRRRASITRSNCLDHSSRFPLICSPSPSPFPSTSHSATQSPHLGAVNPFQLKAFLRQVRHPFEQVKGLTALADVDKVGQFFSIQPLYRAHCVRCSKQADTSVAVVLCSAVEAFRRRQDRSVNLAHRL